MKKFNEFINEGLLAAMKPKSKEELSDLVLDIPSFIVNSKQDILDDIKGMDVVDEYGVEDDMSILANSVDFLIKEIGSEYGKVMLYSGWNSTVNINYIMGIIKPLLKTPIISTKEPFTFDMYKDFKIVIIHNKYNFGIPDILFDIEKMREILNEEI